MHGPTNVKKIDRNISSLQRRSLRDVCESWN